MFPLGQPSSRPVALDRSGREALSADTRAVSPAWRVPAAPPRASAAASAGPPKRAALRPGQPWRIQAMSGSGGPAGGRCWQSHQLPPRHSSWCAARQAEQTMLPLSRFLTASWAPFRGAVLQLTAQPTPSSVDVGQRGFRGSSPGLTPRAKAKLPKATSSIGRHGSEQDWPARLRGLLRRRWRGASGDAVRRLALPHSGRPRCRTFLAGKRHR